MMKFPGKVSKMQGYCNNHKSLFFEKRLNLPLKVGRTDLEVISVRDERSWELFDVY